MSHDWLPELLEPLEFENTQNDYLKRAFEAYKQSFPQNKLSNGDYKVIFRRYQDQHGWPATFWHLISEGKPENLRKISPERIKRIQWVAAVILEFLNVYPKPSTNRILWWMTTFHKNTRVLIATEDYKYLVVLEVRRDYFLLCTAYPTWESNVPKLQRQYANYWAEKAEAALRRLRNSSELTGE